MTQLRRLHLQPIHNGLKYFLLCVPDLSVLPLQCLLAVVNWLQVNEFESYLAHIDSKQTREIVFLPSACYNCMSGVKSFALHF